MKHIDRPALAAVLAEGIAEMGLTVTPGQQERLLDYLTLMAKWNAVYNLTSLRDPMQMVTHHLLDSLAAVPAFAGVASVLDVGSGGGLPGVVLAIVRPDMKVAMIDTVHKKTAYVTVYTARVEQLQVADADRFDVITSRAFADLSDFVNWSAHLLAPNGRYIALKGTAPQDEQQRVPAEWKVSRVEPLHVPKLGAERHLVHIERAAS
jgi:16S rRNA (guanine527-N7)-methyltransferase